LITLLVHLYLITLLVLFNNTHLPLLRLCTYLQNYSSPRILSSILVEEIGRPYSLFSSSVKKECYEDVLLSLADEVVIAIRLRWMAYNLADRDKSSVRWTNNFEACLGLTGSDGAVEFIVYAMLTSACYSNAERVVEWKSYAFYLLH
jgi:hypothetical protein